MAKIKVRESLILAAFVTAAMMLMNVVLNALGKPQQGLFSVKDVVSQAVGYIPTPVSPITGTVGTKVLGWLGGYLPLEGLDFTIAGILFVSAFLIVLAGNFLLSLNVPVLKGRTGRIASVVLWGAAGFYLLLVGVGGITITTIVGLALYTLPVAFVAGWLADMMKISV